MRKRWAQAEGGVIETGSNPHVQGRVMPRSWDGWRFNEKSGEIISPEGWCFDPGRLRALEILCRNGELRRSNPELWDSVKGLLSGGG